jgi:hypothetical protein
MVYLSGAFGRQGAAARREICTVQNDMQRFILCHPEIHIVGYEQSSNATRPSQHKTPNTSKCRLVTLAIQSI